MAVAMVAAVAWQKHNMESDARLFLPVQLLSSSSAQIGYCYAAGRRTVGFVRVSSFVQGLAGEDGAGEHAVFPSLPKPGKGQGQSVFLVM